MDVLPDSVFDAWRRGHWENVAARNGIDKSPSKALITDHTTSVGGLNSFFGFDRKNFELRSWQAVIWVFPS